MRSVPLLGACAGAATAGLWVAKRASGGGSLWGLSGQRLKSSADKDSVAPLQSVMSSAGSLASVPSLDDLDGSLDLEIPSFTLETGAASIPHVDKAAKGGEDSWFVSRNGTALGVADGVGSWAEIGVDAGEYARQLMHHAERFSETVPPDKAAPHLILEHAHANTKLRGSSTACILTLEDDTLHAANLGDSGFIIVRKNEVVFRSKTQEHNFNFPYQLSCTGPMRDPPSAAQPYSLTLQNGDIIVLGTDGWIDNVFPEESAAIVAYHKGRGASAEVAAVALARMAFSRSMDTQHASPFSYSANAYGFPYHGGKQDDITVVVSYVSLPKTEF